MVNVHLIGSAALNESLRAAGLPEFRSQDAELAGFPRTGDQVTDPDGSGRLKVLGVTWVPGEDFARVTLT